MSVWNSLWRSNYSFETSAYIYFEVLLQLQSLSTLLIVGSSPPWPAILSTAFGPVALLRIRASSAKSPGRTCPGKKQKRDP